MKSLLIAGGGKFGKKALEFAKQNDFNTIIIDNNPDCLASKYVNNTFTSLGTLLDAFYNSMKPNLFLLLNDIKIINTLLLDTEIQFSYIIPVIPIHLTALIVQTILEAEGNDLTPDTSFCEKSVNDLKKDILLNYNCKDGVIYLSYTKEGETCPDDCPGPPNYCPNFNREKPITITKYIHTFFNVSNRFTLLEKEGTLVIIIHSFQLKPGLGGLKGKDIYEILSNLSKKLEDLHRNQLKIIIGTTCNCHGVLNFLNL